MLKVSNRKCQNCGKLNPPDSRFCNGCGNTFDSAVSASGVLLPGSVLRGTYVVESVLGQGGMATVYACHHKTLGTKYALKVLEACHARIEILRERFLSEAKIQATVDHPNIVHVADVIDSEGILAMVMEYVEGESLDKRIDAKKQFSLQESIEMVLVILDAVGFAHQSNIVHRDLKPSNVMLSKGVSSERIWEGIKVMDFGIAKILAADDQRTATGTSMGTPRYMAPEQIEDSRIVDARTDIYSIGIILYELLCGRTPFHEYREYELMKAQITMKPPSLRKFRQDVPEKLEAIVMKALEKDPNNRYRNAKAFQRALLSLGGFEPVKLLLNPSLSNLASVTASNNLQEKIGRAIDKSKLDKETVLDNQNIIHEPEATLKSSVNSPKPQPVSASHVEASPRAVRPKTAKATKQTSNNKTKVTESLSVSNKSVVLNDSTTNRADTEGIKPKRKPATVRHLSGVVENSVSKVAPKPPVEASEVILKNSENSENSELPSKGHKALQVFLVVFMLGILGIGIFYRLSLNTQQNSNNSKSSASDNNSTVQNAEAPQTEGGVWKSLKSLFGQADNPNNEQRNDTGEGNLRQEVSEYALKTEQTPTGLMTIIPSQKHWVSVWDGKSLALKQHEMPEFSIDQVEVSNFQYQKCVSAGVCSPIALNLDSLNKPVTNVGYGSAETFCKWAQKRLPTEWEWEAAARFGGDTDGLTFVNVQCESVNFGRKDGGECAQKKLVAQSESVFSRVSFANPGHLVHILGNVREWTSSHDPKSPQKRFVKGGSFLSERSEIRISARLQHSLNQGAADIGFRCVK